MFFVEGKVSNGTICMNVDREFGGIPRRTASQLIEFFDNRELIAQKKAMTSQEAKVAIRLDGFRMEMAEAVGVSIKTVFNTVFNRQSLLEISDENVLFKPHQELFNYDWSGERLPRFGVATAGSDLPIEGWSFSIFCKNGTCPVQTCLVNHHYRMMFGSQWEIESY